MKPDPALRILLVEDNEGDAELLRDLLSERAFDITWTSRLGAGIDAARASPPDLALLDLHLPDSRGLDTVRRFHEAAPEVPIVVLTSESGDRLALEALNLGAQDYLAKGGVDADALARGLTFAVERARAERIIAHYREAAARQEKLAALGTLVAGMAHEINNPLTYVQGNLELAHESIQALAAPALTAEEREAHVQELTHHVAMAQQGSERIAKITKAIRGASRANDEAPADRDLDELVDETLELVAARLHDVQVLREGRVDAQVRVQAGPVRQVLLNLILNACDAVRGAATKRIQLRTLRRGELAVFEIEDNGTGISAEARRQVFAPFFTTKPEGTGLGLHISRAIAHSHGGSLDFACPPGGGTRFRLELPLARSEQPL